MLYLFYVIIFCLKKKLLRHNLSRSKCLKFPEVATSNGSHRHICMQTKLGYIFLAYICGIQWFTQREEKRTQSKRCSKFRGKRAEKRPQTKRSSKFRGNGVLNPMTVLRTEMHAMSKYLRSKGLDSASKRAKALSRLALHVVSHEFPMED